MFGIHDRLKVKVNTILVTGSSGRIGSALIQSLQNDYTIIGVDIRKGPCTTHIVDIQSPNIVNLVGKADIVVHAAALLPQHVGLYDDKKFWDVNVLGTENLLNACLKTKVSRFVLTSSTSVYGHAMVHPEETVWVTEELQPQPKDIYDKTKLAAEELCHSAINSGLMSCLCLRISRCFPEDARLMAIYRLYRGIDIQDVVLAHRLAITSNLKGFDIMNISSKTPFDSSELNDLYHHADIQMIKHHPDAQEIFQERGWTLPKKIDRVYVIEKAEKLLGFHPAHNFMEFLAKTNCVGNEI